MAKNITYLLGAGASYKACPILSEQGEKMIELAQTFNNLKDDGSFIRNERLEYMERIFEDMDYFGKRAKEFGTIDTYARKLFLNDDNELSRLKVAVSLFFTVWQLTDDKKFKTLEKRPNSEIDNRYISLLATILEKKDNNIVMKENINFVTWNYDLQFEYALKLFNNNLDFKVLLNDSQLQICHLNGYHGFYQTSKNKKDFLGRTASKNIKDIIDAIAFVSESQDKGTIDITGHINYAWEESDIASKTRKEAKRIFAQTDILIIIGYSFPSFNKDIDSSLFKELKGEKIEIYYQDPNASKEIFSQLINIKESQIVLRNNIDYFFLPYSF